MKFLAVLELSRKTATGIVVPEEIVQQLGAGKRPKVTVTIGQYTYRTTVGTMGGRYMIPVNAENRQAANVAAGDQLEVEIELDTEQRELKIPSDFSAALAEHAEAKIFFEGLSYSNKRRFILNIEGAKTEKTRLRRMEKAILLLSQSKLQ